MGPFHGFPDTAQGLDPGQDGFFEGLDVREDGFRGRSGFDVAGVAERPAHRVDVACLLQQLGQGVPAAEVVE